MTKPVTTTDTEPLEPTSTPRKNFVRRFFSALGPGLITGAADDDPSGVATYSVAGARLGTSLLWTAAITWGLTVSAEVMPAVNTAMAIFPEVNCGCGLAARIPFRCPS